MMKRFLLVGLALSALGFMQATPASADGWDKQSVSMLSQAPTDAGPLDRASSTIPAAVGAQQEGQALGNALTSRVLTLIVLIGCVGICLGTLLTHFRRPVAVANR